MLKFFYIFSILVVFIANISFAKIIISPTYVGWLVNVTYILGITLLIPSIYKKGKKLEWAYIGTMLLGLLFHSFLPEEEKYPLINAIQWIFPVIIIIASRKYRPPVLFFYLLLTFFITHSVLAIIEYKLQNNLYDYSYVEGFSLYSDSKDFRAFGLMEHPLYSANVTLIIMSFIMISKDINSGLKITLLTLGTLAMLCFNSRTAMIICGCLLIYRYLLYNIKPIFIIILGVLIYALFLSDIVSFIQQNSTIFGRLAEKNNLTDDSSLSRLMSYMFFWNAGWNFQDIVLGGRIIYMPGTEYSLENGILLTISWWGWIVGVLKVILELVISYLCLKNYNVKDKWMVMIACWGTAFANNNSINTFVFVFFIVSFLSINSLAYKKNMKKPQRYLQF
jgi:hypothetical protein